MYKGSIKIVKDWHGIRAGFILTWSEARCVFEHTYPSGHKCSMSRGAMEMFKATGHVVPERTHPLDKLLFKEKEWK